MTPRQRIDAWTTFDFTARYTLPQGALGPVGGTVVGLAALNVFNKQPPFVDDSALFGVRTFSFDPDNADPSGRRLALTLSKRW